MDQSKMIKMLIENSSIDIFESSNRYINENNKVINETLEELKKLTPKNTQDQLENIIDNLNILSVDNGFMLGVDTICLILGIKQIYNSY